MLTSALMLVMFLVAFHGVREPRRQSRQDFRRAKLSLVRIPFVTTTEVIEGVRFTTHSTLNGEYQWCETSMFNQGSSTYKIRSTS